MPPLAGSCLTLGLAVVMLASCGTSPAPPGTRQPPPEIIVTTGPGRDHHIISVRSGATLRDLPSGSLALSLSSGGDIAEAYLATGSGGHTEVLRILPAKRYATEPLAEVAGAGEPQAALLPAPLLSHFVGLKTVLAIRFGDGRLTGYQAGVQVWTVAHPTIDGRPASQLVALGGAAALGDGVAAWARLQPETGEIKPVEGCEAGPLAALGSAVVFSCRGELDTVPALGSPVPVGQLVGVPWALPTPGGGVLLVWPGGDFLRLDRRFVVAGRGRLPPPNARPVLTPDGNRLLTVTDSGVLAVDLGTQRSNQVIAEAGIDSLAESRDGNFVYLLRAGRLEVFDSTSGARLGEHPVVGTEIEAVAGG